MDQSIAWNANPTIDESLRREVEIQVDRVWTSIRPTLISAILALCHGGLTPLRFQKFETELQVVVRELGRLLLESIVNRLEGNDPGMLPHRLVYQQQLYRRLGRKTRAKVATLFGIIDVFRFPYRFCDRDVPEPCIFRLDLSLGLLCHVTPALASRIGCRLAAAGATQNRVLQELNAEHNVSLSVWKLRRLTEILSDGLGESRESAQINLLLEALQTAFDSSGSRKPVLAVGRDGITLREYWYRIFEVATAGTISVYDRKGKRLTTVYLACVPELGQATMTQTLTSLLGQVLGAWSGPLPTLAYVTDSGDQESRYFDEVLRNMRHPRTQALLSWQRVVDFYHVAERIWTIAWSLFGKDTDEGRGWARRMLKKLKQPRGAKRVLHSTAAYATRCTMSETAAREFRTACQYIRNRTRWLNYHDYRRRHIPLGSGVTEAACKTVFTARLKLSGMRWTKAGAERILTLRTILLSGTWDATFQGHLSRLEIELPVPYDPIPSGRLEIAA